VWRTNDVSGATGLLGRATALLPTGARRAELQWERSIALRLHGRAEEADAALAQAEVDAHESGALGISARVDAERTQLLLLAGELPLDKAVAAFERSLSTLRDERDHRGRGRAEFYTGLVHALACNLAAQAVAAQDAAVHYRLAGFSAAACVGAHAEALYYGATDVETASMACSAMLESAPDRLSEANVMSVLGGLRALAGAVDDSLELLDHARALYEDTGSSRSIQLVWTPLRIEAETLAGDVAGAAARAAANVEELSRIGEGAYASTRALLLAELQLLLGDDIAADRSATFAEKNALASDVLVQFLRRSLRARLHARSGDLDDAETLARDAVAIASLTDALRDRARAHVALAEVLRLAGKPAGARAEEAAAEKLLRRKGVKGALAGAPST
jgi:tetratricopeptide (TPR) repeat protein